jgi:hypothetical protein
MAIETVSDLAQPNQNSASVSGAKPHTLHEVVKHLGDARAQKPRFKTREVIGYLLGHGARAWRGSLPAVRPRLKVMSPNGHYAVKVRFS